MDFNVKALTMSCRAASVISDDSIVLDKTIELPDLADATDEVAVYCFEEAGSEFDAVIVVKEASNAMEARKAVAKTSFLQELHEGEFDLDKTLIIYQGQSPLQKREIKGHKSRATQSQLQSKAKPKPNAVKAKPTPKAEPQPKTSNNVKIDEAPWEEVDAQALMADIQNGYQKILRMWAESDAAESDAAEAPAKELPEAPIEEPNAATAVNSFGALAAKVDDLAAQVALIPQLQAEVNELKAQLANQQSQPADSVEAELARLREENAKLREENAKLREEQAQAKAVETVNLQNASEVEALRHISAQRLEKVKALETELKQSQNALGAARGEIQDLKKLVERDKTARTEVVDLQMELDELGEQLKTAYEQGYELGYDNGFVAGADTAEAHVKAADAAPAEDKDSCIDVVAESDYSSAEEYLLDTYDDIEFRDCEDLML